MSVTGGCLCGAVRYESANPPVTVRQCWCRACQYAAGGSAITNAFFPSEAFAVTGEVRWYAATADSGNVIERGFCPVCGTGLFSRAAVRPYVTVVRVGSLDEPDAAAPQSIIWTASAPGWACLDPALPHVEGQPAPVPPPA